MPDAEYVAFMNTPGYLPENMDGQIVTYQSAADAWFSLAADLDFLVDNWWGCVPAPGLAESIEASISQAFDTIESMALKNMPGVIEVSTPWTRTIADLPLALTVEAVEHVEYPHLPGYLYDCPACEMSCHCAEGTAECVYGGEHLDR